MTSPSNMPRCPECGAAYRPGGGRCWLCGGHLPQLKAHDVASRPAPVPRRGEIIDAALVTPDSTATFSLTSVFLVMTLAAVAAGIFAAAPGLGIVFLVVATPALARTMVASSRRKGLGVATTPGAKILDFMQSTAVVLLILLCVAAALGVALFMACTGGVAGMALSSAAGKGPEAGFGAGAAVGGLVALAGIVALSWAIWRSSRGRH